MIIIDEALVSINQTLEKQNGILQQMLDIMPRPKGKFTRALETGVLLVTIFGIVFIVDTVMKWIGG